ncbi:MAG: zinc ribbon domain-containing protein [Fimbriiglobus sp.]
MLDHGQEVLEPEGVDIMTQAVSPLLRECHRARKHLRELQSEIDLGPRVLKIQQEKLAKAEAAHKEHFDTIKKLKLKQKDDEITLKQTETRLAKLQADINMASSKKEFDAKTHEIEMANEAKGKLEDEILTTITEIEERTAAIPTVEKTWADAQAEFKQYQIDAAERLVRLQGEQVSTQATLDATEAKLPPEMKGQYLRIVKGYGADGFAAVNGRNCGNCRTSITEQQKTSLIGGSFICCPQCGRGLYVAQ